MKIYLASFLEEENFGPGRLIGVANGNKPEHVSCDVVFSSLVPSNEIMVQYRDASVNDPRNAGKNFVDAFNMQLDQFCSNVTKKAQEENKNVMEVLPFKDGDTLASWEREAFTNYRGQVANCLERLGYEVELH